MFSALKRTVIDRLGITRVAAQAHTASIAAGVLESRIDRLSVQIDALREQCAEFERWRTVALGTELTAAAAESPTMVSVVLATRDRAGLLVGALDSVRRQRHTNWQLVVVDDGSTDRTAEVLQTIADPRVVTLRTEGVGAAAARQLALAHIAGDWVTFLDDDNSMHPGWLHAIASYATRYPDAMVMYGAQIRQDEQPDSPLAVGMLWTPGVTAEELITRNSIDLGALAVRADHPELRFDAALPRFIDWELVVRLARSSDLLALPVWAGVYTTQARQRISTRGGAAAIEAFVSRLNDHDDPAGLPAGGERPGDAPPVNHHDP